MIDDFGDLSGGTALPLCKGDMVRADSPGQKLPLDTKGKLQVKLMDTQPPGAGGVSEPPLGLGRDSASW